MCLFTKCRQVLQTDKIKRAQICPLVANFLCLLQYQWHVSRWYTYISCPLWRHESQSTSANNVQGGSTNFDASLWAWSCPSL